ncbi:hypothetical protein ABKV19_024892 [Rosa sericea]
MKFQSRRLIQPVMLSNYMHDVLGLRLIRMFEGKALKRNRGTSEPNNTKISASTILLVVHTCMLHLKCSIDPTVLKQICGLWSIGVITYILDFEEFCVAAISTYQLEALEGWEKIASTAFECFEREGSRVISVEELPQEMNLGPTSIVLSTQRLDQNLRQKT